MFHAAFRHFPFRTLAKRTAPCLAAVNGPLPGCRLAAHQVVKGAPRKAQTPGRAVTTRGMRRGAQDAPPSAPARIPGRRLGNGGLHLPRIGHGRYTLAPGASQRKNRSLSTFFSDPMASATMAAIGIAVVVRTASADADPACPVPQKGVKGTSSPRRSPWTMLQGTRRRREEMPLGTFPAGTAAGSPVLPPVRRHGPPGRLRPFALHRRAAVRMRPPLFGHAVHSRRTRRLLATLLRG
jgi:hypothetical protein